jgi:ABC-type antimicrobial peptide transport system permease subunit
VIGLFAAFGLLLASIGLYGVMAFLVNQQTREIGVRMAVGATPANITRDVLKHGLTWIAIGVGFGLAGSFALTHLARSLLFEVSPHDPISMLAAVSALISAATAACWWPSYSASKVDPAVSLRHE